jgi:hypothetical protein
MNIDMTRVRFSDRAIWGENENKKFKIVEERMLEKPLEYSPLILVTFT